MLATMVGMVMTVATALTTDALDWPAKLDYMGEIPVINKAGVEVPFLPNWLQKRMYGVMEAQMQAVGKVRLLVLKGRRGGASEGVTRLFDEETTRFKNRQFSIASNDAAGTKFIWEKLERVVEGKPPEHRLKTKGGKDFTLTAVRYASPHNSIFRTFTAGTTTAGRGGENHGFHGCEVAWWIHGKAVWTSMSKTIPDEPGTYVIWETTANGQDELFYPAWQAAKERLRKNPDDLDGWIPLFFCWLDDPDCGKATPGRYELGELSQIEGDLVERGATPENLYFRRWSISNDYIGDPELFKQEFPSYDDEAFLHSERRVFAEAACERLDAMCEPPERYALTWTAETRLGMEAKPFDPGLGLETWMVWKTPHPEHDYVVFSDVALGILCDPDNPRSDPDWSVSGVLDRVSLEIVAAMRNRMDPGFLGQEMIKVALWYNNAWVAPEVPGPGYATLQAIRTHEYTHRGLVDGVEREVKSTYGRIYRREKPADKLEVSEMEVLGWRTDLGTRPIMMRDIKAIVHRDPLHGWRDRLRLYWDLAVAEMRTFEVSKSGKPEARVGTHDDIVLFLAGVWQLHLRCPRGLAPKPVVRRRRSRLAEIPGEAGDPLLRKLTKRVARGRVR